MKLPVAHDAQWGIYRDADGTTISQKEIEAALNAHDLLINALMEIVACDPYKQSSSGVIARKALSAVGAA